jgi:hypothetical protein
VGPTNKPSPSAQQTTGTISDSSSRQTKPLQLRRAAEHQAPHFWIVPRTFQFIMKPALNEAAQHRIMGAPTTSASPISS